MQALNDLGILLTDTARGRGRVAVVRGPVGSGKTTLLRWLADNAVRRGFTFLEAGGSRSERHLPLGVLSQLFQGSPLSAGLAAQVDALLRDAYSGDGTVESPEADDARLSPSGTWQLHQALLQENRLRPLLIGIDDVEHVDTPSLRWLLYMARRNQSCRIAIVFNVRDGERAPHPLLHGELLHQSHCHFIPLSLLSGPGTAEIMGEKLGRPAPADLVAECQAVTGGNPLLVDAVLDDHLGNLGGDGLRVGDEYGRAVARCLYRSDPAALDVAAAVAVLGDNATPAVLSRLVGIDSYSLTQVLAELERAGLLDERHRFRHRVAETAALQHLTPDDRARLHQQAAHLLHDEGAPLTTVADRLVAAGRKVDGWAIEALLTSARQAVAEDEYALAIAHLKLAQESCLDDTQRAEITALLADVEWRLNPAMSVRRLGQLTAALRRGQLAGRLALIPVRQLLWHGQIDAAVEALRRLATDAGTLDVETAAEVHGVQMEVSSIYPSHTRRLVAARESLARMKVTSVVVGQQLQAAAAMRAAFNDEPADSAVATAEHLLQQVILSDSWPTTIAGALITLIGANQLRSAHTWCDALLAEAERRNIPSWQAILTAIHGEIALRQGDLPGAERYARAALRYMPPEGWGVAVGGPLAILISSTTAMGKDAEAVRTLSEPVPASMFQSVYGLQYLRAQGRYYLATKRYGDALTNFQTCRDIVRDWGQDLPTFAPWRIDVAEAYLGLGQQRQARQLIQEELSQTAVKNTRHYGQLMRIAAATSDLSQQPGLLTTAVKALEGSGDRFQLAWALADLATAHHALGQTALATAAARQALQAAAECRAHRLEWHVRATMGPMLEANGRADLPAPAAGAADSRIDVDVLSDAELRVAALAVRGHTNKEIATKLYITISTVEQHLTRIYRKLKVHRRNDLRVKLEPHLSDTA